MGAGVSDWQLANAVARTGQLGVVSGTALDAILIRRLQLGDPGGHVRRAMAAFPLPGIADAILERYFIEGGKAPDAKFAVHPKHKLPLTRLTEDLLVVGNFVEVFLAKEGHGNEVGINFLEKIQIPHLPSIYGAMLGGVDYVLMGAGIPRAIPGILDDLAAGLAVEYKIDHKGATDAGDPYSRFDPNEYVGGPLPVVRRPRFLAIVASHVLATMFVRKVEATVDGFVIEYPTAGGHNAPPRGRTIISDAGEPVYGEKDIPDLEVFRSLGLPFWMAGGYGEPEQLQWALAQGATGIQVGTAFAYCEESGVESSVKGEVLGLSAEGEAMVFTDPVASPTGFPFKVVELEDSLSNPVLYEERDRICDLGYLRTAYEKDDGSTGWRCPSEPVKDYLRKGGDIADTVGRKCLCNALMANIGLGQITKQGTTEGTLVTSGDDVANVARFLSPGQSTYGAADVVRYLLKEDPVD